MIQVNGKAEQLLTTGRKINTDSLLTLKTTKENKDRSFETLSGDSLVGATAASVFDELGKEGVSYLQLPKGASVKITWLEGQEPLQVNYYDFLDEYTFPSLRSLAQREAKNKGNKIREIRGSCGSLLPEVAKRQLSFSGTSLLCYGQSLDKGVLIQIRVGNSDHHTYLYLQNARAPVFGAEIGIPLTLINRWDDDDKDEGFRQSSAGVGAYYSLTNLHTERWRGILKVSSLDMDSELDFELGVGLGLLFKIKQSFRDSNSGLGIAAGIGYNLMLADSRKAWYTFVGFTANFNQK
ncbi:MAG: hypothetical protein K0U98_05815 [Deltaproteobacteria bacterium]|nr:hypothetical protein [Deltaproteobacteria bacterium]